MLGFTFARVKENSDDVLKLLSLSITSNSFQFGNDFFLITIQFIDAFFIVDKVANAYRKNLRKAANILKPRVPIRS